MRLRLLRPPPITVHLDRDYRIEPIWMEAAQSGYLAAYFSGSSHWRLSDGYHTPAALARALIQAGLAEALSPA